MTNYNFYSAPSNMAGGYTVYGGYRRQRGGGIFASIRNAMAPIGRVALTAMKSLAKNKTAQKIAKQAAKKGAEVLTGVAVDTIQGRDVGESFKERSREAALQTLAGAPSDASTKPKRKRKLKQKKRSAPAKNITQPAAKKRRQSLSRAALNRKNLF